MIGEYISALANSAALCNKEHAYLIYGVDDKSKEVLGTDFDFNNSKKEMSHYIIGYIEN